jgi:hypothetical protein
VEPKGRRIFVSPVSLGVARDSRVGDAHAHGRPSSAAASDRKREGDVARLTVWGISPGRRGRERRPGRPLRAKRIRRAAFCWFVTFPCFLLLREPIRVCHEAWKVEMKSWEFWTVLALGGGPGYDRPA